MRNISFRIFLFLGILMFIFFQSADYNATNVTMVNLLNREYIIKLGEHHIGRKN